MKSPENGQYPSVYLSTDELMLGFFLHRVGLDTGFGSAIIDLYPRYRYKQLKKSAK